MKRTKLILKFDMPTHMVEEVLEHLEHNYNFKTLDQEEYEEEDKE